MVVECNDNIDINRFNNETKTHNDSTTRKTYFTYKKYDNLNLKSYNHNYFNTIYNNTYEAKIKKYFNDTKTFSKQHIRPQIFYVLMSVIALLTCIVILSVISSKCYKRVKKKKKTKSSCKSSAFLSNSVHFLWLTH